MFYSAAEVLPVLSLCVHGILAKNTAKGIYPCAAATVAAGKNAYVIWVTLSILSLWLK